MGSVIFIFYFISTSDPGAVLIYVQLSACLCVIFLFFFFCKPEGADLYRLFPVKENIYSSISRKNK